MPSLWTTGRGGCFRGPATASMQIMEQREIPRLGAQRQRHRPRHLAARARTGGRSIPTLRGHPGGGAAGPASRSSTPPTSTATGAASSSAVSCAEHPEVFVATKMGRRVEQLRRELQPENFLAWNERSRANLGVGATRAGATALPARRGLRGPTHLRCAGRDGRRGRIAPTACRSRPVRRRCRRSPARTWPRSRSSSTASASSRSSRCCPPRARPGVGIIVRVPLASGLLSGRYDETTRFAADDHRNYNRHGEQLRRRRDVCRGALRGRPDRRSSELRELVEPGIPLAQFALRWVIDQTGREHGHPGGAQPRAGDAERGRGGPATAARRAARGVQAIYDRLIRAHVHDRW